jgi:serine/threonine-protein kinase
MRTNILSAAALLVATFFFAASCKKSSGSDNSGNNGNDSSTTVYSTTIAGNSSSGTFDFGPTGVTVDAQGNVYAAIPTDSYIAKITSSGSISIFAGSKANPGCETGTGTSATFTDPTALCIDAQGNIYVADYLCGGIKRISASGVSTKFCSSDVYNNVIIAPQAICIDANGNVYSANQLGEEGIAKTTPGGVVSRFAGSDTAGYQDGPVVTAKFNGLGITGLCADANGNIYVADPPRIRKISNGQVTTVAGNASNGFANGKGSAATFGGAMGICMGPDGNVYIADVYNNMIRMMTPDGTVSTVSGTGNAGFKDGDPKVAQFNQPSNLCFDSKGNLYVADYGNALVRKITFPK